MTEARKEAVRLFSLGRELYKKRDFSGALKKFTAALECCPEDGPSRVFAGRCRELAADPPPEDWDGVFQMKTK